MRQNIRRIIAVCIIALFTAQAVLAQAPEPQPVVREIVFRGVQQLQPQALETIRKELKSEVGKPLNSETVKGDVETITESGWFFRVNARTEVMEGGVRLIFDVVENPVIAAIDFIGNTEEIMSDAELREVVKSQPGLVNRNIVTDDALHIREAYAKKGYTAVEIYDIKINTETKQLEFYIFEVKVSEIRIEGNTKTRENVIRRELEVQPGEVYNEKNVQRSLNNLERLGIFQEVGFGTEPGDQPGTLILVFRVTERRTGLASIGVGHSNIQGLIGFVDVADTNLFGSGQRVSARLQFGADTSYTLSYTNPYIDPKRTSFTMNLYDRTILRQAVDAASDDTFLYNEKRSGGNVTVGRPTGENTRTFITVRNDRVRASEEDDTPVPPLLLTGADVRSLALSQVRDTRKEARTGRANFLNPSAGSYTSGAVEYAGFGGADFRKFTGELRRYWVLRQRKQSEADKKANRWPAPWVLASRVSVGTTAGSPPFLDQFLVGGADTLRGYQEDRFPGENMLLMNNEVRVPLTVAFQLVGFVDVGDAWRGDFAREFGDEELKIHMGYGLGIRIITPIGPLRLDYGLNGEGGKEFHFGVGPTF